jgi:hypothetical protein
LRGDDLHRARLRDHRCSRFGWRATCGILVTRFFSARALPT